MTGTAIIDTAGSSFDTLLAVYTGGAVNALAQVAANDDTASLGLQSRVQFSVTLGATYRVAVDGYGGASGAVALNWSFVAAPPPPTRSLSIADSLVTEGNTGKRNMTFTITLSSVSASAITLSYATANGTAVSPSDFAAKSGAVTVKADAKTATVQISVLGDKVKEANETFSVTLSNASGGTAIARVTAIGTIINDD